MTAANIDSADLKGLVVGGVIREDVMNRIWDISRIPLPFTDMVGSETSKQEYKEWVLDELAAPDLTNARIDGADAGTATSASDVRVGNHHQISDKVVKVSHRADASDTIGRARELAYRLMRNQQELKRDVEAIALSNQASFADTGAAAGKVGTLQAWIETNVDIPAAVATVGGFNTTTAIVDAYTVGARRALTENAVRDVVESIYNEGGDPTRMMAIPAVCRKFSEYLFTSSARVATLTSETGQSSEAATAKGAVNVFVTDFGTLTMVPNRLQQTYNDSAAAVASAVFILDPEYLGLSYLQGYRTDELGKTGTANNRQISVDWTLVVNTEKAHGMITEINSGADVTAS